MSVVNNYVKVRGTTPNDALFRFFDEHDPEARSKAIAFARLHAERADNATRPPSLVGVAVFRALAEAPEILFIGECRDRKDDV